MKITTRQLKRIIREEAGNLREVWDDPDNPIGEHPTLTIVNLEEVEYRVERLIDYVSKKLGPKYGDELRDAIHEPLTAWNAIAEPAGGPW